ncbi:MAG: CoB--CoM heterodisulfide reductase iron-sulfur subunit B family protein [Promethearchaeota archaeon]|nr:MAG: CoB--CoM heterodisulfide reductase iron-sulfur subunit B family protein [Candidatus Lokiarchaeota archaeon]
MNYALFLGCTISIREQNYEMAAREVAKKLKIEFDNLEDFSCCGFPIRSVNTEASLIIAARNLAIAGVKKQKICTLCNACTFVLTEANKELTNNRKLREKINKDLAKIGRKFITGIEVKHFSRILYEDIGLDAIKNKIKNNLCGLKFSIHYGCHYFRPSSLYDYFEDVENPSTVEELVAITGAEVVNYKDKLDCCGGAILGVEEDIALNMAKKKLDNVTVNNVDALIIICPFCSIMYEKNQKKIESKFNVEYNLPVLYFPQVLGLALGIDQIKLGFRLNKIKPFALLEKLKVLK